MASIKDVAELAGVSIATVSRFINRPDTLRSYNREKVEQAMEQTGYFPNTLAQNFRRGRTGVIFLVLPVIGTPFFNSVMRGITNEAQSKGYSILIRETEMNTLSLDQYTDILLSKQADGIVLLGSECPPTSVEKQRSARKEMPIILACENVTTELGRLPSVRIDNRAAAIEATAYLLDLGHKRIGFISGQEHSTLMDEREHGYAEAMEKAGLEVLPGWVQPGDLNVMGARRATRNLLRHQHTPTAIFCANDEMALAAIHEIKCSGLRVPEDISVFGCDDIEFAQISDPPLSTITQPGEQIGSHAIKRLHQAIQGHVLDPRPEFLPYKMTFRESCASPQASEILKA